MKLMKMLSKKRGRMKRSSDMPADLMATNSKFSPMFPKVISEESNMASGNANGTNTAL